VEGGVEMGGKERGKGTVRRTFWQIKVYDYTPADDTSELGAQPFRESRVLIWYI